MAYNTYNGFEMIYSLIAAESILLKLITVLNMKMYQNEIENDPDNLDIDFASDVETIARMLVTERMKSKDDLIDLVRWLIIDKATIINNDLEGI